MAATLLWGPLKYGFRACSASWNRNILSCTNCIPRACLTRIQERQVRVLQYQSGMDLERRNTRKRDLKLAMLIIKFINKIEGIFFILINIHVCVAIFFFHLMQDILLLNNLSLLNTMEKEIAKDVS